MLLQTVTGLAPIDTIGLADGHAHVWINPTEGVAESARIELNDPQRISRELNDFKTAGGTLLVDCQPGGAGRDTRQLARLSRASGVLITATTGFHQRKYYPPDHWLWSASEDAARDFFVEEITVGTRELTNVKATTIKCGYEGVIDGQTRVLMEAAASAAQETGALLLFHTEQGKGIEALIPFFTDRAVPPDRLYLCHVDKRADMGLHSELARAGVLLGYDTFARPKYDPDHNAWRLLGALVAGGFARSVAICLDLAFPANWRAYDGEPGLAFLPRVVLPRLRASGFSDEAITRLTGRNVLERMVHRAA